MKTIVTGTAGLIRVEYFVYASSSSVYGSDKKVTYPTDYKIVDPE